MSPTRGVSLLLMGPGDSARMAAALIVMNLVIHAGWALDVRTVTDSVFQVVTLMTTTGYMTYDYVLWPTFSPCSHWKEKKNCMLAPARRKRAPRC